MAHTPATLERMESSLLETSGSSDIARLLPFGLAENIHVLEPDRGRYAPIRPVLDALGSAVARVQADQAGDGRRPTKGADQFFVASWAFGDSFVSDVSFASCGLIGGRTMDAFQWLTASGAAIGAGLGIFNTVTNFVRGRPKLVGKCEVEDAAEGLKRLRIELINAGRVPVAVSEIYLTGVRPFAPKHPFGKDSPHHPWQAQKLFPADPIVIRSLPLNWLEKPFMASVTGLTLEIAGAHDIKLRCDGLVQHAAQLNVKKGAMKP